MPTASRAARLDAAAVKVATVQQQSKCIAGIMAIAIQSASMPAVVKAAGPPAAALAVRLYARAASLTAATARGVKGCCKVYQLWYRWQQQCQQKLSSCRRLKPGYWDLHRPHCSAVRQKERKKGRTRCGLFTTP